MRLIVHVNQPERWPVGVGAVNNFLADAPGAEVIVLANGAGAAIYGKPAGSEELLEALEALAGRGVRMLVCANALKANAIDEAAAPGFVTAVPSGMTELVRRQEEGFAYVKP